MWLALKEPKNGTNQIKQTTQKNVELLNGKLRACDVDSAAKITCTNTTTVIKT